MYVGICTIHLDLGYPSTGSDHSIRSDFDHGDGGLLNEDEDVLLIKPRLRERK